MNPRRIGAQIRKLEARTARAIYAAVDDPGLAPLAARIASGAPVTAREWIGSIVSACVRVGRVHRVRSVLRRGR